MSGTAERIFAHTESESLLWPPADVSASAYQSALPSAPLRDYVERIHLGYERLPPDAPVEERVLPDGAVHLIFNLGDPPGVVGGESSVSEALGATCEPALVRMAGHVEQVGVKLRPGGLAPFLGVPAGEIAGGAVSLADLWGARAGEALERLAGAPHGPRRVAVMESVLLALLSRGDPCPNLLATEAVRRIYEAGGRIRVRELASTLGVGERRLEQVFHGHVGVPAKTVCRLARFRASVSLLRREPARSWSQIAHRCGYYDQSHLVNEFQALAGLTPRAFRESAGFGFLQDGAAEAL